MNDDKLYITLLLFVKPGEEETFLRYEGKVLPMLAQYNGEVLYRVRPVKKSFVGNAPEQPYEIHVLSFNTRNDYDAFLKDEKRNSYGDLFKQSVEKVILIEGQRTV